MRPLRYVGLVSNALKPRAGAGRVRLRGAVRYQRGQNPRSLANLKPFRPGPDPRRNVTGRNGKAELARKRERRFGALVAVLHSSALSDQEHEDLLHAIAQAFIMDGLIGDAVTVRRIVAYAFRYGF